jgi:hypothetical protein
MIAKRRGVGNVNPFTIELGLRSFTGLPGLESSKALDPAILNTQYLQAKQGFRLSQSSLWIDRIVDFCCPATCYRFWMPTIRRWLTPSLPYDRMVPNNSSNVPPLRTAVARSRFCARGGCRCGYAEAQ